MASASSHQETWEKSPDGAPPFVRLVDVSRSFGNTKALRNATLDVAVRGQMHALVGENGAGKSTCLGVVSGRIPPTSGTVLVDGEELVLGSPRASKNAGIHTIYQELTIVPALSPEANIFLGQHLSRRGWLREASMREEYRNLCERLGVEPVRAAQCGTLSIADQQLIEIMRALISTAHAILLDEPTAALAGHEREILFNTLNGLREQGMALTLVSHNLDEVLEHSDVVTVFRDGEIVAQRPTANWTKHELVSAMLGSTDRGAASPMQARGRDQLLTRSASGGHRARKAPETPRDTPTETVMSVRGLSSPRKLADISFDLRRGEILGIAGLVGSGRTELLRALSGLDERATGTVQVGGSERVPRTVREARDRGIALLPEDRKGQGLVLPRSAADNITLGEWDGLSRMSMLSTRRVNENASKSATPVGFNVARIGERTASFSGGNQQKLLLARWLHTDHPVLLADEPTRGVDVGAKAEIIVALEQLVSTNRSMIVVSSEMEEVVALSDRVLVIHFGRAVALLDAAEAEITVEQILQLIFHSNATPVAG